jgi:hypothetical protein
MNSNTDRKMPEIHSGAVAVKVQDLSGAQLDWAVAKCECLPIVYDPMGFKSGSEAGYWIWDETTGKMTKIGRGYNPSTDWSQAGPILEREGIDLHQNKHSPFHHYGYSESNVSRYPDGEICTTPNGTKYVKVPRKAGPNEGKWVARMSVDHNLFGWKQKDFMSDTPLIAAMRCYVASKFGEFIEIPVKLLG